MVHWYRTNKTIHETATFYSSNGWVQTDFFICEDYITRITPDSKHRDVTAWDFPAN